MSTNRVLTNPNKPGVIFVPELNEEFLLSKEREGIFYDTVEQGTGLATSGTALTLFRDFTNKFAVHMNVGKNGKLPSGNAMALHRTGIQILQCFGNTVTLDTDIIKAAYGTTLKFDINERQIVKTEPTWTLSTGLGISGMTTQNATGIVNIGLPSAAAAPQLRNAQPVLDRDDLNSEIVWQSHAWGGATGLATLTNRVQFMHVLYGVIKQPVAN